MAMSLHQNRFRISPITLNEPAVHTINMYLQFTSTEVKWLGSLVVRASVLRLNGPQANSAFYPVCDGN